ALRDRQGVHAGRSSYHLASGSARTPWLLETVRCRGQPTGVTAVASPHQQAAIRGALHAIFSGAFPPRYTAWRGARRFAPWCRAIFGMRYARGAQASGEHLLHAEFLGAAYVLRTQKMASPRSKRAVPPCQAGRLAQRARTTVKEEG